MKIERIEQSGQQEAVGKRRGASKRSYSAQHKRSVVEQCLRPGASVAAVALSHGINANLVRKWIKKHEGREAAAVLLPVTVSTVTAESALAPPSRPTAPREAAPGALEIELPGGRLRLKGAVDLSAVRAIIGMLSGDR